MDPQIMQKAISSAREALQHAAMHEQKGLPASASTILTIEMVKLQTAYKHFTGQPSRNLRILEDVLQKCQDRESNCRAAARRQMQTYGLLYKQGHFRKNWQTRLFILSGGQLKYYVPGDTEAKGTIYLHQITSVQSTASSQHGFKIETNGGKVYNCQAPDAGSLDAWVNALRPLKVGFLMKQGYGVQQWKKRWCMLWRTQLAFFESQTDNKDRKGYVLLRDILDGGGSVAPVDRSEFGHDNIFRVDTRERKFFMQAISRDDMNEWLNHIRTALQTRGTVDSGDVGTPESTAAAVAVFQSETPELANTESNNEPEPAIDRTQWETPRDPPEPGAPGTSPATLSMPQMEGGMTPNDMEAEMELQLGLQQREMAVQENLLRLREKELYLQNLEMTLDMKQRTIDAQVAALAAQGIVVQMPELPETLLPAPAPAAVPAPDPALSSVTSSPPMPADTQQQSSSAGFVPSEGASQFTFFVTSDELFDDQRKCQVLAADLGELEQAIASKLGLNDAIYVLIYDEDFDEYCLPDSLSDVPATGRIKVKKK